MWPVLLRLFYKRTFKIKYFKNIMYFPSIRHLVTWLLLLLYGILFSQCLHVTSLCDSMCVFSFLPPMQVFSHFSHVRTQSSCFDSICTLRCFFQKELQSYKWHKKACWLQICSANKVVDFRYDDFSVTKTNKTEKRVTIISVRDASPSDRQVSVLGPKKLLRSRH